MNIDFHACAPRALYEAACTGHVFHTGTSIGVTCLGDWFHVYDLSADIETTLAAEHTTPERLQAHAIGFLENRKAANK